MAPGVSLIEKKGPKRSPRFESEYIMASGGVFRQKVKDAEDSSMSRYAMSMRDYRKLKGTRTFNVSNKDDRSSSSSLNASKDRVPASKQPENLVRVINMD